MTNIHLNKSGDEALYIQLYEQILDNIMSGRLSAGSRLPSKRALADELDISQSTVMNAYSMLIDNNFVEARERSGYYVLNTRSDPDDFEEVGETAPQYVFSTNGTFLEHRCEELTRIIKRLSINADCIYNSYVSQWGDIKLRRAISAYLYKMYGVTCSAHQIVIGAGSEYLIQWLLRTFSSSNKIAFESPCNVKMLDIVRSMNFKDVCCITTLDGELDIQALYNSGADIFLTQSCYTFPANETTQEHTKRALINWSVQTPNRFIIESMHDNEFYYTEKPEQPLYNFDNNGKVILTGSFRKSIGWGFPLAYMVLPKTIVEQFGTMNILYMPMVSNFVQLIAEEFIESGGIYKNISTLKKAYRTKRDFAINCLKSSSIGKNISIFGADAGTHFCINVHSCKTSAELRAAALNKGVKLTRLCTYVQNICPKKYENAFPFGYAETSEKDIATGVYLLAQAWKDSL